MISNKSVPELEEYFKLTSCVEHTLDEADAAAEKDSKRYMNDEVFGTLRRKLNGG